MKFSESERRAEGQVRLHRARGLAKLRKVASGSATQCLWLRHRKVGSQVIDEDRSQFPGRRAVGKLGEEEEEPATEQRREYADLGLIWAREKSKSSAMPQPWSLPWR